MTHKINISNLSLVIGQKFWILKITDEMIKSGFEEINDGKSILIHGKCFYDAMSYCVLKRTYQKINDDVNIVKQSKIKALLNTVFCFYSVKNSNEFYEIKYTSLDDCVYKSKDDYLLSLVKTDIRWKTKKFNTTLKFDDFLKQKIKESQEKNPQKWV